MSLPRRGAASRTGTAGARRTWAPELRGSLTGLRGGLTVWLPVLLLVTTMVWFAAHGPVPLWWSAGTLTAAGALLGDPAVRLMLAIARDTASAEHARNAHREQIRADTVLTAPQMADREATASGRDSREQPIRDEDEAPPLRGGLMIGVLERLAVTVCVVSGYASGIAVVVAIKGLARYGELSTPAQREQFIIGTLASLLWAAGTAGAILLLSAPA